MEQGGCLSIDKHLSAFVHEVFQNLQRFRSDCQKIRQDNGLICHLAKFEQRFAFGSFDNAPPLLNCLFIAEINANLMRKQLPFKT